MRSAGRAHVVILALAAAMHCFVRAMQPVQGLGNPDIAGILYSADVINDGGLPYRDTLDFKAPLSFFLVAGVFRFVSRELWAVHAVYFLWVLLAAPAVWMAASELYGEERRGKLASSLAVLFFLMTAGKFDLNYSSWMATPYAWAFALGLRGLRRGGLAYPLAAGVASGLAYAFKQQAVVLAPMLLLLVVWGRSRRMPGATLGAIVLYAIGGVLGFVPLLVPYALEGATRQLLEGLFPLAEAARYGDSAAEGGSPLKLLYEIHAQQVRAFPLQGVAALAALIGVASLRRRPVGAPRPTEEAFSPLAPALVFYLLGIVGCGLGGLRFYVHYLPQCLAGLALIAAHPAGWRWLLVPRLDGWRGAIAFALGRGHLLALAVTGAVLTVQTLRGKANLVDNRGVPGVEEAGRYIRERTAPKDTIVGWGWDTWGVYYFADRRSPSRMFKMLGQVTTYNEGNKLARGRPVKFAPGPLADELVADIETKRPAYFVRAQVFFPGTRRDPLDDFKALRDVLKRDYRRVRSFESLTIYERNDHGPLAASASGAAEPVEAEEEREAEPDR